MVSIEQESGEAAGGAQVRWESGRDIAVVEGWGEIDLAAVPAFTSALETAIEADIAVIVDMSRVSYMDSSGFGALLETSRAAKPLGLTVYLAACNPNVGRMLEITRLNTMFEIAPDVDDARQKAGALTALPS